MLAAAGAQGESGARGSPRSLSLVARSSLPSVARSRRRSKCPLAAWQRHLPTWRPAAAPERHPCNTRRRAAAPALQLPPQPQRHRRSLGATSGTRDVRGSRSTCGGRSLCGAVVGRPTPPACESLEGRAPAGWTTTLAVDADLGRSRYEWRPAAALAFAGRFSASRRRVG
eukprot:1382249-Prymnesium_polylepis.1